MTAGLRKGYEDPRWMTYRQACEHGWQVRKGEKAIQIEFWEIRSGSQKTPRSDTNLNEQDSDRDKTRLIHRVYSVFNARQIDAIPPHTPKQHSPFEVVQAGEQILKNSGAEILYDQADRAYDSHAEDRIHLPPRAAFKDAALFYGTALHEVAHWSGHESRLNRPTLTESYRLGDLNYAKEELRAELASVFLAAERGIPPDPAQHAAYVDSWVESLRRDKHEIFRAAHDASAAVDYLLALEHSRSISTDLAAHAPALDAPGARNVDLKTLHVHPEGTVQGLPDDVTRSLWAAEAIIAKALGASAKTRIPHAECGIYRGMILGETTHHIV
jgi:antirestriction protein ArdC